MKEIEIPESFDNDWQVKQLRRVASLLDDVYSSMPDGVNSDSVEEAQAIIEALQEYSGF